MDFVIPKSLQAGPVDTSETDAKLFRLARQRQRSVALAQGFSAAVSGGGGGGGGGGVGAPEGDYYYNEHGGYGSSCYLGPPSINRFPPVVPPSYYQSPPSHPHGQNNSTKSVAQYRQQQLKRRTTIATVGGLRQSSVVAANDIWAGISFPTTDTAASVMTGTLRRTHSIYNAEDGDLSSTPSQQQHQQHRLLVPVSTVRSFFELSAPGVDGQMVQFSKFDKRMVLVANVASGDKNAIREFTQVGVMKFWKPKYSE